MSVDGVGVVMGGYCASCGQWMVNGMAHTCVYTAAHPTQFTYQYYTVDPALVERIVAALEKIAMALVPEPSGDITNDGTNEIHRRREDQSSEPRSTQEDRGGAAQGGEDPA